ncbi:MAG: glycosyltransferase [Candidatus Stygibacter frigidus]|nr:glycosyltransferase [Candidatus Stygibacter frigidus]
MIDNLLIILMILGAFLFLYHLVLYPLILLLLNMIKKKSTIDYSIPQELPTITILCPAYNEEECLEEKIRSYQNLNYDKNKLRMIVISDDSEDKTNEIVKKHEKTGYIELVVQKPRKGKQSGHNLVEPDIRSKYVVSTDANSIFHPDAVIELVKIIENEDKTGLVSGKLELVVSDEHESGEASYWSFESSLKHNESKLKTIICANGSIFIIRRHLFGQIYPASVDDFERVLITIKKGYNAKYNPQAIVYENSTERASQEIKRKVRIISREWFAIKRQSVLLNVFRYPVVAFFLISHKIIRWLIPLYASLFFIVSLLSLSISNSLFPIAVLGLQIILYATGFIGMYLQAKKIKSSLLRIPTYFTAMIYAGNVGFIKFLQKKKMAIWQTSIRND